MKTAIEWLFDEINNQKCWADPKILNPLFEHAKQKELEQIERAFYAGCQSERQFKARVKCWEEYAETTFKK